MFVHKYSVEIFDIMTHSLMSTTVYTTHIFILNIRHRISQYFNSVNEKFNLNIQQVLKYDLISVFQIFRRNIRHLISHLLTYSFKELLTRVTMSKETTVRFPSGAWSIKKHCSLSWSSNWRASSWRMQQTNGQ